MSLQTTTIVFTTTVSASVAALASPWLDIPQHWEPSYFAGTPAFTCLLTFLVQKVTVAIHERRSRQRYPEHLERFTVSVEYIDREWHRAFELAGQLVEEADTLFGSILDELSEPCANDTTLPNWRYKVVTEITADGLRIADSILSQVRSGHPDTAQATARQLLELAIFQKVIAFDATGETAKRYQDFTEVRYLKDSIDAGSSNKTELGNRIEGITKDYPRGTKFYLPFAWIRLQGEHPPANMDDVIKHVVKQSEQDPRGREIALHLYLRQWVNLNNWTHISKSASRRKLGTRTPDGYLQAHLVEKSRVGLDTPLSLATFFLRDILGTFEQTAFDVTGNAHDESLEKIDGIIYQTGVALDSVDPELLANDFRVTGDPIIGDPISRGPGEQSPRDGT